MRGSSWTAVLATIGALTFGALAQVPKGGPYGLAQTPPMGYVNFVSFCTMHSNSTHSVTAARPSTFTVSSSASERTATRMRDMALGVFD